jgi:D-3-phosphoglycerate dehydrogenase
MLIKKKMTNNKFEVARLNARTFPMTKEEREILSSIDAEIIEIEGETDEEIVSACKNADAIMIVSAYLKGSVLKQLKNLKVISRLGTGVDKIDVDQATKQGVVVTNLPDFATDEVADHTIAILLSVARQLKFYENVIRTGQRPPIHKDLHRLSVQKIGIIGFGRIGRAVANRAKSFGMHVLVLDPMVTPENAANEGVEQVVLETILQESDYLCLLCPLSPATRGMITMKELKMMKQTSVLVNTGRGELINENDLAEALKTGIIRYAAIDVFEGINVFSENGYATDHPFFSLENILLTPHVAAGSVESLTNSRLDGARAVVDVLSGKSPSHCINPTVLKNAK